MARTARRSGGSGLVAELVTRTGDALYAVLVHSYALLIMGYYVVVCAYHRVVPKRAFDEVIAPRSAVAVGLVDLWNLLAIPFKRWLSRGAGVVYERGFSRRYIRPFIALNYADPATLARYRPPGGKPSYESFQDFFTRELAEPPAIDGARVWPCDGLLCEQGRVDDLGLVAVKGERRHLRTIFGDVGPRIAGASWFRNVFLHNRDYHHIHSPAAAVVESIERIAGDLIVLRPWFHLDAASRPALTNERVIVGLRGVDDGQLWALAIVGGPVVGSIVLADGLAVGRQVAVGDKLATFRLGSTCCFTSPVGAAGHRVGDKVRMGRALDGRGDAA